MTSPQLEQTKQRLCAAVDERAGLLSEVASSLHATPELCYEEHFAHDLLCDILEREGLTTDRGAFGIPTAFAARAGNRGPVVAVCCEYDALPGIGHACGHNLIAAMGLGAGLGAATVAGALGGQVLVLGTPAEEGGGGKVRMLDAGAFDDVDAALMIHPAGVELRSMQTLANQQVVATFVGQSAHAAAAPEKGRNALDAAVLGYMNVAALRQHLRSDERVHGIFTDGGDKPNIVPARAAQHWYVRAADVAHLEALKPRVTACLQAGATAAGCEVHLEWIEPGYADMRDNLPLIEMYAANAATLGRHPVDAGPGEAVVGSTDMGNVSYVVPSIHPMIKVAPAEVAIHTERFADCAASPMAHRAVLDGAKAMAMTIADLWIDADALASVRQAFESQR